jgi:hypothetical protein
MGHLLGYARVSTTDQQPQLQVDALERTGCYRVFTETASGARADRRGAASLWSGPCEGSGLAEHGELAGGIPRRGSGRARP